MEDIGRVSISQEIFSERALTIYVFPHCNCSLLDVHTCCRRLDTATATSESSNTAAGGAQHAAANTTGERSQDTGGATRPQRKRSGSPEVLEARAAPWWLCDDWVNAPKLLANQQKDGDSPIQSIVTGLHERSRRGIMDGLRNFNAVDNRSSVDVGGLRRGTISIFVQKQKFSEAFSGVIIREGADELALRGEELGMQRSFIDTKHIEIERWGPPLVDADWHASCQAIHKGIEGDEWKEMCYRYRELNQAAGAKKPSESQKAKAFSAMKAARDRDE